MLTVPLVCILFMSLIPCLIPKDKMMLAVFMSWLISFCHVDPIQLVEVRHFLLKCLYTTRTMSSYVHVCMYAMYMCVCMLCTCVYVCYVHVCMYVMCMCVCMLCTCVYACYVHVCMYVMYMCVCMLCTCVYVCYVHVCMYVMYVCVSGVNLSLFLRLFYIIFKLFRQWAKYFVEFRKSSWNEVFVSH
jgi:hypothetical protein